MVIVQGLLFLCELLALARLFSISGGNGAFNSANQAREIEKAQPAGTEDRIVTFRFDAAVTFAVSFVSQF
jgi:hypothetical protein